MGDGSLATVECQVSGIMLWKGKGRDGDRKPLPIGPLLPCLTYHRWGGNYYPGVSLHDGEEKRIPEPGERIYAVSGIGGRCSTTALLWKPYNKACRESLRRFRAGAQRRESLTAAEAAQENRPGTRNASGVRLMDVLYQEKRI